MSGQIYGKRAFDDEARTDLEHLEAFAHTVADTGIKVNAALGFGRVPDQIIRLARENNIDVLVMGGTDTAGSKISSSVLQFQKCDISRPFPC